MWGAPGFASSVKGDFSAWENALLLGLPGLEPLCILTLVDHMLRDFGILGLFGVWGAAAHCWGTFGLGTAGFILRWEAEKFDKTGGSDVRTLSLCREVCVFYPVRVIPV